MSQSLKDSGFEEFSRNKPASKRLFSPTNRPVEEFNIKDYFKANDARIG